MRKGTKEPGSGGTAPARVSVTCGSVLSYVRSIGGDFSGEPPEFRSWGFESEILY